MKVNSLAETPNYLVLGETGSPKCASPIYKTPRQSKGNEGATHLHTTHLEKPNCVVLQLAAVDNLGLLAVFNSAVLRADILNLLDDRHGAFVSNLTKHNVLAVEPGSLNCSDEELRAVTTIKKKKKKHQHVSF